MENKTFNTQNATIVYQMTKEQLFDFAHRVVEETRDSVAEELHKRVAAAVGNRLDYISTDEACRITGKTDRQLRNMRNKGLLRVEYNGGKVLYLRKDVVKYANNK